MTGDNVLPPGRKTDSAASKKYKLYNLLNWCNWDKLDIRDTFEYGCFETGPNHTYLIVQVQGQEGQNGILCGFNIVCILSILTFRARLIRKIDHPWGGFLLLIPVDAG